MERASLAKASIERNYLELAERDARASGARLPTAPSMLRARRCRARAQLSAQSMIGKGAHGEVRLCSEKATGSVYAIKCFGKPSYGDKEQLDRIYMEREVLIALASARCPWVTRLHDCFQTDSLLCLALEYVPGGDLMSLMQRRGVLPEADAFFYVCELVMAVGAVHELGYAHRDIKPDNVLIAADGHLKLADFSLARRLAREAAGARDELVTDDDNDESLTALCKLALADNVEAKPAFTHSLPVYGAGGSPPASERARPAHDCADPSAPDGPGGPASAAPSVSKPARLAPRGSLVYSRVGTPNYVAPEVLVGGGYSFECDWWSVGVITFEMLCGYQPFAAPTPQATCDRVLMWPHTLSFPQTVALSPAAVDFVRALLCARDVRLGADDGLEAVKSHGWFLGTHWPTLGERPAPYVPALSGAADVSHYAEQCGQLGELELNDEPSSAAAAAWSARGGVHMMAWNYRVDGPEPADEGAEPAEEGAPAPRARAPIEAPRPSIALSPRISPLPACPSGRSSAGSGGSRRGSAASSDHDIVALEVIQPAAAGACVASSRARAQTATDTLGARLLSRLHLGRAPQPLSQPRVQPPVLTTPSLMRRRTALSSSLNPGPEAQELGSPSSPKQPVEDARKRGFGAFNWLHGPKMQPYANGSPALTPALDKPGGAEPAADALALDGPGSFERLSSDTVLVWGAHEGGPSSWSGRSIEASGWTSEARPVAKPIEEADPSGSPSRRRKVRLPSPTGSAMQ